MRKKTISNLAEHILWCVILLLPVLLLLISPLGYSIGGGTSLSDADIVIPDFASVLSEFGLTTENIIYTSLSDLFGAGGLLPFFASNSSILLYFAYFIYVEVLHLVIDVLVFIPRLAHKWLNKCTMEVEYE